MWNEIFRERVCRFLKKIACLFVIFSLLWGCLSVGATETDLDFETPLVPTASSAIGQPLDLKARSVILMEVATGTVLYEDNADQVLPPASITKIMSLLLTMEALDRGDLTLETVLTASEHACSMGGSQIWLEPNEPMTVDDLLKATAIASANDATVVLGEAIAGSEEGFVALMNERAKELGMNNTNFVNATGLDAEGHVTTAHDVALMSVELLKHPLIKNYTTVWMDSLRGGESELVNTNKLVRFYEGTTGLKTGTTSGAGYCLSASANRGGMELVAVVMGGDTSNDRFNAAKKLLDYGFANYTLSVLDAALENGLKLSVEGGVAPNVELIAPKTVSLLMQKTAAGSVERRVILPKSVKAPLKKGQRVGRVELTVDGQTVGEIPIETTAAVQKMGFGVALKWMLGGFLCT